MQCNVIRNGDVLMVDSFMDLKEYLAFMDLKEYPGSIVTMSSVNTGHNGGGIHKLIVKNSKCSLPIDEIKHCLRNSVLDELKEIEIITGDERLRAINGMLYSQNARRLYFCPRGMDGTLVIPDGTDTITDGSCYNCNLSKVIIPDSVKRIDGCAFMRNYALEYVKGCKNVERIGNYAFAYCKQLKKFQFGELIKNIGSSAFCDTMLTEIYLPEGLSRVGRQAFNTIWIEDGSQTLIGPSQMYDIRIPSTLKYIEPYAFANAANVYTSFVNAALIKACMRSVYPCNLQHCHECKTWRLKIKGKPDVIVPKAINASSHAAKIANKINATFGLIKNGKLQTDKADNVVSEAVIPPELYQYSTGSTGLTVALEQCRKYPNDRLKRFITKNVSVIFYNLIISPFNNNGEEIMVSLIKDDVFTDTALKKLLEEIEQSDKKDSLITLKAYAMNTIKHKNNSFKI